MWEVFVFNNPPVISSTPDSMGNVSVVYTYNPNSTDELVGIPVPVYSITTNYTGGYGFNIFTGEISFSPTYGGSYWFNLTFDDQSWVDNGTIYQNFTVTVLSAAPVVIVPTPAVPGTVSASFKNYVIGFVITLKDSSFGNATSYLWDFGDGQTSTDRNASHQYDRPGTYKVVFTVFGADGKSYSISTQVEVGKGLPFVENREALMIGLILFVAVSFYFISFPGKRRLR